MEGERLGRDCHSVALSHRGTTKGRDGDDSAKGKKEQGRRGAGAGGGRCKGGGVAVGWWRHLLSCLVGGLRGQRWPSDDASGGEANDSTQKARRVRGVAGTSLEATGMDEGGREEGGKMVLGGQARNEWEEWRL
ncbi:hypothetical protein ACQY0O_004996 [Thecaphora frezii]